MQQSREISRVDPVPGGGTSEAPAGEAPGASSVAKELAHSVKQPKAANIARHETHASVVAPLPPAPTTAELILPAKKESRRLLSMGTKLLAGNLLVIAVCFVVPPLIEYFYPDKSGETLVAVKVASVFLGILTAGFVSLFLARSMTRNLERLSASADRISQGDLSRLVNLKERRYFTDDIQRLAKSVNRMVNNLRNLVWHIKSTSQSLSGSADKLTVSVDGISTAASEIATSMEQIAGGAELQSELVERTSMVIGRMAALTETISKDAEDTAKAVQETNEAAQSGAGVAKLAVEKIRVVFEKIEKASEMVIHFGDKIREVDQFVEVITNVSQQTHLLALNATIEAARAGEAGRGFAVVAEEVRKLSESTSQSAEQISRLVQGIAGESVKVVSSMREGISDLAGEREDLSKLIQSLENIVSSAVAGAQKVETIAQMVREQREGAEQVVRAINNISQVTESNATSTQEVSATTEAQSASMLEVDRFARELAEFASRMEAAVSNFKL